MSSFLPQALQLIRMRSQLTRGQVAKRLKISPTIVFNYEKGRSRIKLNYFFKLLELCKRDASDLISRHTFTIKDSINLSSPELFLSFRKKFRLSQKELAKKLGYSSASMVHHFEKGIREPSLEDFFNLMRLDQSDLHGMVLELTGDKSIASHFYKGQGAQYENWGEYWSHYYISALRQLMRTEAYAMKSSYTLGDFCKVLGITKHQEFHGLKVLERVGLLVWENSMPRINKDVKIVIPKGISQEIIQRYLIDWLEFGRKYYASQANDHTLLSVDLLPINKSLFAKIIEKIRDIQDEIHNLPLPETDGFVHLQWMANYIPLESDKSVK